MRTVTLFIVTSFVLFSQNLKQFEELLEKKNQSGIDLKEFRNFVDIDGSFNVASEGLNNPKRCSNSAFALGVLATKDSLNRLKDFIKNRPDNIDLDCVVDAIWGIAITVKYNKQLRSEATIILKEMSDQNGIFWSDVIVPLDHPYYYNDRKKVLNYLSQKAKSAILAIDKFSHNRENYFLQKLICYNKDMSLVEFEEQKDLENYNISISEDKTFFMKILEKIGISEKYYIVFMFSIIIVSVSIIFFNFLIKNGSSFKKLPKSTTEEMQKRVKYIINNRI